MEYFVDALVSITTTLGGLGYVLVFAAALVETTLGVGLILPGSTLILLAGMSAMHGVMNPWFVIPSAALGGIVGDNVNYYLGNRFGRGWLDRHRWLMRPRRFTQGERFFTHHGGKSVFIGRFVPVIKEIVPFIAGLMHMDKRQFFLYNVLGALGWSALWVGVGYFFAYSLEQAKTWVARIELTGLLIVVLLLGYLFMRSWLRRQ